MTKNLVVRNASFAILDKIVILLKKSQDYVKNLSKLTVSNIDKI